ncbi:MAG: hypothetical protein JO337_09230 [Acidimicrobiales bacterium]|nr:hypothetical protein [Acidimicrobiales bacterium]
MNRLTRLLLRRAMREGWKRGVAGGSSLWAVIGGLGLIGWLATRALHREPEVVFSEKLGPGESIRIRHEARA